MSNIDKLTQLRDAIKAAHPTDSSEITLVRQMGTLEGILYTLMITNTEVKKTVEFMIKYYEERKIA
jgi:hypothetical protein